MRLASRTLLIAVGVIMHAGCALHRTASPVDRFFLHKNAKASVQKPDAAPEPSLEEAIGKVRQLMATAKPAPRQESPTLEQRDPVLAAALKTLGDFMSVQHLYEVGAAYHRVGLFDKAFQYYNRALALDGRHAASHEGLARVWRDWRMPQLGLGDAHRAIYYAPSSASARNTLGTVLQSIGRRAEARAAYAAAIALDREAGYAFNNLCYLSFSEGNASQAIDECRAAIRIDPALAAAHNNLALTYAAIGRMDAASAEFAQAGGQSNPAYNMGIVYLAQAKYGDAADAFEAAQAEGPRLVDAERRARSARQLALSDRTIRGEQ